MIAGALLVFGALACVAYGLYRLVLDGPAEGV